MNYKSDSLTIRPRLPQYLTSRFLHRGYPREWIEEAKRKVVNTSQSQCLCGMANETQSGNGPFCSVKYSALGVEFRKALYKHWHIISSDSKLSHIFKDGPRLVFKRQSNLRDMLVRSEFSSNVVKHYLYSSSW